MEHNKNDTFRYDFCIKNYVRFVFTSMSYLCYLCLFCIVVSNTYCVVFLLCFFFVLCTLCCQVSLDCPFLIVPSVFLTFIHINWPMMSREYQSVMSPVLLTINSNESLTQLSSKGLNMVYISVNISYMYGIYISIST